MTRGMITTVMQDYVRVKLLLSTLAHFKYPYSIGMEYATMASVQLLINVFWVDL